MRPTSQLMSNRLSVMPDAAPQLTFKNTDLRSALYLHEAQAQKLYMEGYLLVRHALAVDGQPDHRGDHFHLWTECFVQLNGTVLSIWDASELERGLSEGRQVPPRFINITDALVDYIGLHIDAPFSDPGKRRPLHHVFSLNTAGSNRILFCYSVPPPCDPQRVEQRISAKQKHHPEHAAVVEWLATGWRFLQAWINAIRLASWERSRLDEIYTGALIRARLSAVHQMPGGDPGDVVVRSPLVKGRYEGYVRARFMGSTDWRKCYMSLHSHWAEDEPVHGLRRFLRLSVGDRSSFMSHSHEPELGEPPAPPPGSIASPAVAYFYEHKRSKRPFASLWHVHHTYAVYPSRPDLVEDSVLFKVEGVLPQNPVVSATHRPRRTGWVMFMPETGSQPTRHASVEMMKWVVAFMDAFRLYGRPEQFVWDPRNPVSPFFAYPIGPYKDHLFLDRALAEYLDITIEDHLTTRQQLHEVMAARMRGENTPLLPPLPPLVRSGEAAAPAVMAQPTTENASQSVAGAEAPVTLASEPAQEPPAPLHESKLTAGAFRQRASMQFDRPAPEPAAEVRDDAGEDSYWRRAPQVASPLQAEQKVPDALAATMSFDQAYDKYDLDRDGVQPADVYATYSEMYEPQPAMAESLQPSSVAAERPETAAPASFPDATAPQPHPVNPRHDQIYAWPISESASAARPNEGAGVSAKHTKAASQLLGTRESAPDAFASQRLPVRMDGVASEMPRRVSRPLPEPSLPPSSSQTDVAAGLLPPNSATQATSKPASAPLIPSSTSRMAAGPELFGLPTNATAVSPAPLSGSTSASHTASTPIGSSAGVPISSDTGFDAQVTANETAGEAATQHGAAPALSDSISGTPMSPAVPLHLSFLAPSISAGDTSQDTWNGAPALPSADAPQPAEAPSFSTPGPLPRVEPLQLGDQKSHAAPSATRATQRFVSSSTNASNEARLVQDYLDDDCTGLAPLDLTPATRSIVTPVQSARTTSDEGPSTGGSSAMRGVQADEMLCGGSSEDTAADVTASAPAHAAAHDAYEEPSPKVGRPSAVSYEGMSDVYSESHPRVVSIHGSAHYPSSFGANRRVQERQMPGGVGRASSAAQDWVDKDEMLDAPTVEPRIADEPIDTVAASDTRRSLYANPAQGTSKDSVGAFDDCRGTLLDPRAGEARERHADSGGAAAMQPSQSIQSFMLPMYGPFGAAAAMHPSASASSFGSKTASPSSRPTFVKFDQEKAQASPYAPNGLLAHASQERIDRRMYENEARGAGNVLINVPSKPPPPQAGLMGAIHSRERRMQAANTPPEQARARPTSATGTPNMAAAYSRGYSPMPSQTPQQQMFMNMYYWQQQQMMMMMGMMPGMSREAIQAQQQAMQAAQQAYFQAYVATRVILTFPAWRRYKASLSACLRCRQRTAHRLWLYHAVPRHRGTHYTVTAACPKRMPPATEVHVLSGVARAWVAACSGCVVTDGAPKQNHG